jgi:hypothetical protein
LVTHATDPVGETPVTVAVHNVVFVTVTVEGVQVTEVLLAKGSGAAASTGMT